MEKLKEEDFKIGQELEDNLNKKEQEKVTELAQEELSSHFSIKEDGRSILIMIAVLAGIFILFFAGSKLYNHFTSATVINIDDLHKDNLEGKLDQEDGYIYEGFSFIKADGLWWTEVKTPDRLLKIPLHFGPRDLEEVEIIGSLNLEFNRGNDIFIAINPLVVDKYYTLAISELSFNIVQGLNKNPVGSCTSENYACDNRTIVSCADNPDDKPVIELALGEKSTIELDGSCIMITGNGLDLVKAVDRLLYQWYGVMS